jgi:hypothetical protein
MGMEAVLGTPGQAADLVNREIDRWTSVIQRNGITAEGS